MPPIARVWSHEGGPPAGFHRLRPLWTYEHLGTIDLVQSAVTRPLVRDPFLVAADAHGERLALDAGHGAHAGNFQQIRNVSSSMLATNTYLDSMGTKASLPAGRPSVERSSRYRKIRNGILAAQRGFPENPRADGRRHDQAAVRFSTVSLARPLKPLRGKLSSPSRTGLSRNGYLSNIAQSAVIVAPSPHAYVARPPPSSPRARSRR